MSSLPLGTTAPSRRESSWRQALRWGLFPAVLGAAALASVAIHFNRVDAMAAQMGVFIVALLAIVFVERTMPCDARWRQGSAQERRVDLTSWLMLMAVFDPLLKRVLLPLLVALTVTVANPSGGLGWFPTGLPVALQLLLAAVIAEFGQYWMHRAAHHGGWMWKVHTMHHSPSRIYLANGFRVNPINMFWHQMSGPLVLMLIGAPTAVIQMLILFSTVVAVFQHANADLRYDGWNRWLATADLHRWHHAAGADAPRVNFGSLLMLWDQLFGTYHRSGTEPSAVGIDGYVEPKGGYLAWLRATTI